VTARQGTCITDVEAGSRMSDWIAQCGHGYDWRLGDTPAMCFECVNGQCNHPKHGIDIEQLTL
jgi:hypothetical protein